MQKVIESSKFYHNDISLEVPESVYYPREDSLLLAKHLKNEQLQGKRCLDMGCGSGFFAVLMAKKGAAVTAADTNPEAVEITKKNAEANNVKVHTVKSDGFSSIDDKYDFISFNPPYLPSEDTHQHKDQWSGGKTGREMIEKFVKQLSQHLNRDGKVLMVFSSLTGEQAVKDLAEQNGFSFSVIDREKISWEELILAEIRKIII